MLSKKEWLYWSLQFTGWSIYGFFMILSAFAFQTGDIPVGLTISLNATIAYCCLTVSHLMRLYFKAHNWTRYSLRKLLPRVLIAITLSAILAQALIHLAMFLILDWEDYRPIEIREVPIYLFYTMFMFLIWCIFYFGYHSFARATKSEMEKLQVEGALKDAELIALKAQINPHFMFNALNNIKAMVLENPMKSRHMISNLSDLLRYSIQFNNHETVDLEEEIKIVEDYLKLESVQYEDRLTYTLDIHPDTLKLRIPPMVIQLLVENAVKHGISQLKKGGYIQVFTKLQGESLMVKVVNSGSMEANVRAGGLGINNALERIRIISHSKPDFKLFEDNNEVHAILKLKVYDHQYNH